MNNLQKKNYAFLLPVAFLIPSILGFLFPKLKKLGIGTSDFLLNLIENVINENVNAINLILAKYHI